MEECVKLSALEILISVPFSVSYLYILNSTCKNLDSFFSFFNTISLCFVSGKLKYSFVCDFSPKPSAFLTEFKKKQPIT